MAGGSGSGSGSGVVELFSTSILSNINVRTRHERFTSVFAIKNIAYTYHDLASDDDAKRRWRRKAKHPQLPGILVNNEWVGSYDEFEEAVEFGELELFLGVSPAATRVGAEGGVHPAQLAVSSNDASLYPTLPYAVEGARGWKEPHVDEFISSLNIQHAELDDADVEAMLAHVGNMRLESAQGTRYVPSKQAAIKPLRLAKMGVPSSHQRMASASASPSAGSASRASPIARYSATQRSTNALAAEAAALTSNRNASGALLREAVSQGKTLDDAMEQSQMKHIVSQHNIDDLFASLGLSNVDIGDDEVDRFLEQGSIPHGLRMGGERVHRASSIADKARDEAVANQLVLKAKQKAHRSARTSLADEGGGADVSSASGCTSAMSSQVTMHTDASSSDTPEAPPHEASATVKHDERVESAETTALDDEQQEPQHASPEVADESKPASHDAHTHTHPHTHTHTHTPTSSAHTPADDDSSQTEAASAPRLEVGATVPRAPRAPRQASSSSTSVLSSRRAIDVPRPIDPATSPPLAMQHASGGDVSTSPETRRKKGMRGFGLGRDRDKDKDRNKDGETAGDNKVVGGAGTARRERTISQILREADAVLQSDEFEVRSDDEDAEDPAMFGSCSIDVGSPPTRAACGLDAE